MNGLTHVIDCNFGRDRKKVEPIMKQQRQRAARCSPITTHDLDYVDVCDAPSSGGINSQMDFTIILLAGEGPGGRARDDLDSRGILPKLFNRNVI